MTVRPILRHLAGTGIALRGNDIDTDRIERAVIDLLRRELTSPALIAEYVRAYNEERRRLAAGRLAARAKIAQRLEQVTAEIDRTFDWMVKGVVTAERYAPKLKALEAEEAELKAELAAAPSAPEVVTLHPGAIARYRQQLETLELSLTDREGRPHREVADALRALIARIVVHPDYQIEIEGRLEELTGAAAYPSVRKHGGQVVAEEGFEPPTPGL